jgi:hypothetical protein
MTELLLAARSARCQSGGSCDRIPCFQARLEAAAGLQPVRRHARLCAEHLGCAVQSLATWGREQGLEGKVIVLAIDPPLAGQASQDAGLLDAGLLDAVRPDSWARAGFAFSTILLSS